MHPCDFATLAMTFRGCMNPANPIEKCTEKLSTDVKQEAVEVEEDRKDG